MAVPVLKPPAPEFGDRKTYKTPLDKTLDGLERAKVIRFEKNGEKYKQFWVMQNGAVHVIKVDLFLITFTAQWGVGMVIRTGPSEFSHWCVTQKSLGGALPNGYRVQDLAVLKGEAHTKYPDLDERILMPEEKDFLEFIGLGWVEPAERQAEWRIVT